MRRGLAIGLALVAACGGPVPEDRSIPVEPAPVAAPVRCEASDDLGGSFKEWLPGDLRMAAVIELEDPGLPAAISQLQAGVQGRGLPVVASLGLGQLGLQLGLLRPQLITAGLRPRQVLLLHDRAGAVLWVLRARCDVAALQATLAETWSLRFRKLSEGSLGEAVGGRFAFDVVFLSADRIALAPPGTGAQQRRWLELGPTTPALGGPGATPPGAVLDDLAVAPIRGVLSGRSLGEVAGTQPLVRTLRASATGLEVDGVLGP